MRFELEGAVVAPGERDVPLDLYITSAMEWSGFTASIVFPFPILGRYLEVTHVEEHIRPGVVRIGGHGDALGYLVIAMLNSHRRVGGEGERVKVATLHVAVNEAAGEVSEVLPLFQEHLGVGNWVAIRHQGGIAGDLPVTAQVAPLSVAAGLLRLQTRPTALGDVNLDYTLNLTDAVVLLDDLFLGGQGVVCPEAADYTADGTVNLTDPVGLLNFLFLGGPPAPAREIRCRP